MAATNYYGHQSPTSQRHSVSADDIKGLLDAILGAPYGNPLLEAAQLLELPEPDLNRVVGLIEGVKNEYMIRSERLLSNANEALSVRVRDNLQQFVHVLVCLNAIRKEQTGSQIESVEGPLPTPSGRNNPGRVASARGFLVSASVQLAVGDFGTVIQLVSAVRLSQNGRIVVNLSDVSSGLNSARRELEIGNLDEAAKSVQKLCSTNDKKIRSWENQARQREAQSAAMSMSERDKMRAEHHGVRNRYRMTQTQFRRLSKLLEELQKEEGESNVVAATSRKIATSTATRTKKFDGARDSMSHSDSESFRLPPLFLEKFRAAKREQHAEVVLAYFEIDQSLQVEVMDADSGVRRIEFRPFPLADRFYFLTATAKIIQTCRANIGREIRFHDPDMFKNDTMTLRQFVEHVRRGVWLLREKTNQSTAKSRVNR